MANLTKTQITEIAESLSYVRKNFIETGASRDVIFSVIINNLDHQLGAAGELARIANRVLYSIECAECGGDFFAPSEKVMFCSAECTEKEAKRTGRKSLFTN